MNYPQFVKLARSYAKASDEAQIRLLRLLMDVHEAPAIWQSKHSTWEEVLRAEKFCTVHRYTSFRKAVSLGISPEKLGVDAACLLATYSSDPRSRSLKASRIFEASRIFDVLNWRRPFSNCSEKKGFYPLWVSEKKSPQKSCSTLAGTRIPTTPSRKCSG